MTVEEKRALWARREARAETASGRAIVLSLAVAAGNGALMAALWAHPLPNPSWQIAAGCAAMGLHGWGAWEIGRAALAWARASQALAWQAAGLLREDLTAAVEQARAHAGPPRGRPPA